MYLRPYQTECLDQCLALLKRGVRRQVVSLPVGSGKTTIFSHLISRVPAPTPLATKTLVLAHRSELINQAAIRIAQLNPNLVVDIEQGERHASLLADVVVASVPTLGRSLTNRILKYDPDLFKCIIIDEAHHATATSYVRTVDHFKARENHSHIFLWGCSATVRRFDGIGLDAVFEQVAFHRSLVDLMREGWICPMKVTSINTQVDLSSIAVSSRGSGETDFVQTQLARAINTPSRNQIVVDMWKQLAAGRKSTLVFAVNIAHIRALVRAFQEAGIDADSVDSHSSQNQRIDVMRSFTEGRLPVLVNCGVVTEGTDIPSIDCIIMARPTRSSVLFQQMIGRGLRRAEGKSNCLVLDLVDSFANKGLVTVPSLLGLDPEFRMENEDLIQTYDRMKEAVGTTGLALEAKSLTDALERVVSIKDLDPFAEVSESYFTMSKYAWIRLNDNLFILDLGMSGQLRLERDTSTGIFKAWTRLKLKNGILSHSQQVPLQADSLSSALLAMDTYISSKLSVRSAPWRKQPASPNQINYLKKLGALRFRKEDEIEKLTKGEAQRMITLIINGAAKTAPTLQETKGRQLESIIDN